MTDRGEAGRRPFRVLATCGVFEPGFRGGGPVRSVARIVDTLPESTELALVTGDRDLGSSEPYPGLSGRWVARRRARVFYLDRHNPQQWLRLWRDLRKVRFDLLYLNSLWAPIYTVIPVVAVQLRMIKVEAVLIAPRGELSPGALSLKSRKKRLFLRWWAPFLKSMGVVWHATADREASDIRAVFPWAHVEINQNQTSLPPEPLPAMEHPGPVRLVFIGRVSAKKNLRLAISALMHMSGPAEFDIYGPLEDGAYWSTCQELMSQLPPTVKVTYRGELAPGDVRRTFAEYDAFVFPTLGENFGHVIAESLSASCPVICSDSTPWTQILERGGGAIIRELTPECLGRELDRIAAMDPAARLAARHAAGDAYRAWRAGAPGVNILELARTAPWSGSR